jgi:hypothetical protein
METNIVETLPELQESQPQCECAAQISDIHTRLEKLKRDALTVEKLTSLEPSISDALPQAQQRGNYFQRDQIEV